MPLSFALIGELAHICIEYMYELHDFYWEVCPLADYFDKKIDALSLSLFRISHRCQRCSRSTSTHSGCCSWWT